MYLETEKLFTASNVSLKRINLIKALKFKKSFSNVIDLFKHRNQNLN